MKRKAIIALGGNALIKKGQTGNIYEQFANTRVISKSIVKMIKENWNIVITHGNGPQVGAILIQNNAARDILPPMPLGICVAESEGLIGYMIQQCLYNALKDSNIEKTVVSIITQVLVDKNDPSFSNPTKPIGPIYSTDEVQKLTNDGYQMKQQSNGWRIVVPSPDPMAIIEGKIIKKMLEEEIIVIAAGGGGMPVIENKRNQLDGVEAVVDKDLASERLAEAVEADLLLILTNVDKVFLNYNTSKQIALEEVTLNEIRKYYNQGQFPSGNMGPKILAAIRFLEYGGKKVIISNIEKGFEAINGETGTHIYK